MQIQKNTHTNTNIQIEIQVLNPWATLMAWFTHIPDGHFNSVKYKEIHQDFTIINHHHHDIDIFATKV